MKIKVRPAINQTKRIWEQISDEKLKVTYKGEEFELDFSELLPDEGDETSDSWRISDDSNTRIVDHAKRENGEVYVTIFESVPGGEHWWFSDWYDSLPESINSDTEFASKKLPKNKGSMTEQEKEDYGIA